MYEGAMRIARKLVERGYAAVFAGGCVRDFLMGRMPQDIDIATDATPTEVAAIFDRAVLVGASFGVVVVPEPPYMYDVATFRVEGPYTDGRHPSEVRFATQKEDAQRRDFTINGMFYDPFEQVVIDYVGGQTDLDAGLVRAIGDPDRRFDEDKLRMIRAVRFTARDGFSMDPATLAACQRRSAEILETSWERIGVEIMKIMTQGNARFGLEMLDRTGLLDSVMPEVAAMRGVEQPSGHPEGDVFVHTLVMLGFMGRAAPEIAFGTLLHDVGKPATIEYADRIRFPYHSRVGAGIARDLCERLRYPKRFSERVSAIVGDHMRFKDARQMKPSTLKRFLRLPHFVNLLEVHRLDCMASHGNMKNWSFCAAHLAGMSDVEKTRQPLISGDDLIALGYRQGPRFREILTAVEDAWLEGKVKDPASARSFVVRMFPRRHS
ncbi:MAG: CCA tRNA nucleotidyltransferase [Candidatus Hydrogenedentes bacterium]|nr:CCA tRNA nucleotidyltransferase [Candidatus Hydrogenedentota bacterium]